MSGFANGGHHRTNQKLSRRQKTSETERTAIIFILVMMLLSLGGVFHHGAWLVVLWLEAGRGIGGRRRIDGPEIGAT